MSTITKIDKFMVHDHPSEKIEVRYYYSGHVRRFIWQGERWYPIDLHWFNFHMDAGHIVPDEEDNA